MTTTHEITRSTPTATATPTATGTPTSSPGTASVTYGRGWPALAVTRSLKERSSQVVGVCVHVPIMIPRRVRFLALPTVCIISVGDNAIVIDSHA